VAFVILFFAPVDLTQELELLDASKAVLHGYPFATVAFVAADLLFVQCRFVTLLLHRGHYPDVWVLLVHTLVATIGPALDLVFVFGEPLRHSAFLEERYVMASSGHGRTDVQHEAVFVRQHLGHEREGLSHSPYTKQRAFGDDHQCKAPGRQASVTSRYTLQLVQCN
jgi:hypothetical protein